MIFRKSEKPERVDHRRPCEVDGSKAWYHGLINSDRACLKLSKTMAPADHAKAHQRFRLFGEIPPDGELHTIRQTFAMVEYLDGSVSKVDPEKVHFTDV